MKGRYLLSHPKLLPLPDNHVRGLSRVGHQSLLSQPLWQ